MYGGESEEKEREREKKITNGERVWDLNRIICKPRGEQSIVTVIPCDNDIDAEARQGETIMLVGSLANVADTKNTIQ